MSKDAGSKDAVSGDAGSEDVVSGQEQPQRPLLRVVRGEPDHAELAALTAVVLGLASAPRAETVQPRRSAWADHATAMRGTLAHGPGAWRASGLPR